jgi:hypothetical protein
VWLFREVKGVQCLTLLQGLRLWLEVAAHSLTLIKQQALHTNSQQTCAHLR